MHAHSNCQKRSHPASAVDHTHLIRDVCQDGAAMEYVHLPLAMLTSHIVCSCVQRPPIIGEAEVTEEQDWQRGCGCLKHACKHTVEGC